MFSNKPDENWIKNPGSSPTHKLIFSQSLVFDSKQPSLSSLTASTSSLSLLTLSRASSDDLVPLVSLSTSAWTKDMFPRHHRWGWNKSLIYEWRIIMLGPIQFTRRSLIDIFTWDMMSLPDASPCLSLFVPSHASAAHVTLVWIFYIFVRTSAWQSNATSEPWHWHHAGLPLVKTAAFWLANVDILMGCCRGVAQLWLLRWELLG